MPTEEVFKKSFEKVISYLKSDGNNLTTIAKAMGYTTTAQLHHASSEQSLPSLKAIMLLIDRFNINPTFLFTGHGEITSDDSEIETLSKEVRRLEELSNESLKTIMNLTQDIKLLEKRNADLIDITSDAIKYHKQIKEASDNKEIKK